MATKPPPDHQPPATRADRAPRRPQLRFPGRPTYIGRPLRLAYLHLVAEVDEAMSRQYAETTPAINRAMLVLDREGTRLTDLADRLQMTKQSAGELVDRMEEAGFVERRPDPTDGRAKLVCFTPKGWDAIVAGFDVTRQLHERWTALLGRKKTEQLVRLLDELTQRLDDDAAHGAAGAAGG